jgi:hypothetical protein
MTVPIADPRFVKIIAVRTVEVHRTRMKERLGVRQLAKAIRLAVLALLKQAGGAC